jgi:predicted HTH transcriptional regulator
MDENLWKLENFQLFLEARRKMLATQLNKFLAGITDTERTEVETPIEEIIAEGESRELEFKASMRWDLKFSKTSPVIEHNIMKAVASFSNADGGTLLIGVKDNGEPVGLDYDYESLNGDKDKFELHLRNLLRKNFDTAFAANNISVSFPIVDNIEICRIDVKRSSKPIFIIKQEKNGQKEEVFYVRSGNSSPALKPSEASEFISQRFNS